jgi:ABC-type proline/glycine betaine transport system ATPase subunit
VGSNTYDYIPKYSDRALHLVGLVQHTIIDSDRILVLEAGKVAELDTPTTLLARPVSIFRTLLFLSTFDTLTYR